MKILAAVLCGILVFGFAANAAAAGKLMHVVAFKFKSSASPEDIKKVEQAFEKLKHQIPQVVTLEWGTNVSPEGKSEGFTHCFVVTFKDAKARDAYLPHAAHKEFVSLLLPRLEKVMVVDYFAQK